MLLGASELVARVMGCILSLDAKKAKALAIINELFMSAVLFLTCVNNQQFSTIFLP